MLITLSTILILLNMPTRRTVRRCDICEQFSNNNLGSQKPFLSALMLQLENTNPVLAGYPAIWSNPFHLYFL